MENYFCDFLINIGLIDLKASKKLKEINKEVFTTKNIHNFSDCFFVSLMNYFNNLTISQKKYMCFNLPLRFLLNKEKEKKRKISLIILKKQLKDKILKLKYLLTWIRNNKSNKIKIKPKSKHPRRTILNCRISFDEYMNKNKKEEDKINYQNININNTYTNSTSKLNIRKINSYNNSKVNDYYINKANNIINSKEILTTSDKLELLHLSECTFKPSINTSNNSFRNTKIKSEFQSTFEKLYKDSEKYGIKKKLLAMEYENMISKELTFKPKICRTPKQISSIKFEKFDIRQENFIKNKINNANRLKKNIERNAERKCSFTPKINKLIDFATSSVNNNHNKTNEDISNLNSKNNNNNKTNEDNSNLNSKNNLNNNNCDSYYSISTIKTIPAHVRLYNDSKRRNSSYIQKEIEYKKLIKELANMTSKKNSKINYIKLNNLHQNKEKKIIMDKIKKKVELEEGTTFKPELNSNNKYTERIFSDFYDRNKNFKKNKIFSNYDKFHEDKGKKYTEEEKKQIIKNIVNRLYREPMSQTMMNKKIECNKYIKTNFLVDSSRTNIQKPISESNSKIN